MPAHRRAVGEPRPHDAVVARFLGELVHGASREGYGHRLRSWEEYCALRGIDLLAPRSGDVERYREQLSSVVDGRPLQPSTRRVHLAVLARFYRWLGAQEDLDTATITIKVPPPEPVAAAYLTPDQAQHVLELGRDRLHTADDPVPLALVCLFLMYGQAPSAVELLTAADYRAGQGTHPGTINACGRAGVRHLLPVLGPAAEVLPTLAHRARQNGGERAPLFAGKRVPRLRRHAAAAAIAQLNHDAPTPLRDSEGNPLHITPRLLTNTLARAAARAGAPTRTIVDLFGLDFAEFHRSSGATATRPIPQVVLDYVAGD